MKESQKVVAQVKALIEKYDYKSQKPLTIELELTSVDLPNVDVLTYQITIKGGMFMYASGDSFQTALRRLEIQFENKDENEDAIF